MAQIAPELGDYARWAALNSDGNFGLFDYAYGVFKSKALSADLMLAVIRLCWPEFAQRGGCILLKEQFDESKFDGFVAQGLARREIELWCNMFCVDGMLDGAQGGSNEHISVIAEILRAAWDSKLKTDYPALQFDVQVLSDEDVGDTCVSFFQKELSIR